MSCEWTLPTVTATSTMGIDKDAVEKKKKLAGQPLLGKNRQYLFFGAGLQLLERGFGRKLLPLCAERIISATTDAGPADLFRWLNPQDVSRTVWLAPRAVGLYDARILPLFTVLQKTRSDRNKPFQLRYLQELIFTDGSRGPSCWKCELLLLMLHLRKNLGTMWKGCRDAATDNALVQQPTTPVSILFCAN